jgi:hypothetical protein
MSISELFRYQNDSFQSDIFSSNIGITDVNVGCQISPTLRSILMPTYAHHAAAVVSSSNLSDHRLRGTRSKPSTATAWWADCRGGGGQEGG